MYISFFLDLLRRLLNKTQSLIIPNIHLNTSLKKFPCFCKISTKCYNASDLLFKTEYEMNFLNIKNFGSLSIYLISIIIEITGKISRFSMRIVFCSLLICALLLPTSQSIKAQGANPDSLALVALYNALDGPNWNNNTNWLTGEPVSSWYGIMTNDSGRVETIELSYNNLSGTIPPEIGNLMNLINLYLGNNQLTGSIPPELGNLMNINDLRINRNQLTGSIPYELGDLAYLGLLQLDNNQLTGSIPIELGNIKNLQYLYLNDNQLTDSIPPELGNLVILWGLYLNNNQLSGTIPPELGNLVILKRLELVNNQLTGSIPQEIGNLVNLEFLDLRGNQLSGSIPQEIGNLANLEYLFLAGNQLTGSIPTEIGDLANLESLSIPNNQLTGTIPPEIGNLTNLESMNLNENKLTGTIPPELGNMLNLRYSLSLKNNQLTGEIPHEIGNLVNLSSLCLSHNQLTGSIPPEIGNLENLQSLDLGFNQLTGSIPHEIGNLANLESLYLTNNQLTGSIQPEIGNLINLKDLSFTNNQLTGSIPSEIGNLVNLIHLNLSHNQLTGMIPPEIGNLTNVGGFILNDNQLIGSIPVEIGNLTNLINLWLYNNRLCGSIPQINGFKEYHSCLLLYNNQFNDMTDSLSITPSSSVKVYSNKLTFEDIEPNVGHFSTFVYAPQDSVGMRKDTTVAVGSSFTLSVQVGGSANKYQWMKDGTDITGANDSTLNMSSVQASDAGEYICKITNTIATDLTLYSRPTTVHVDTTAIVFISDTDTVNAVTLLTDSSTVTVNFTNKSSLSINFTSGNVANNVLTVTQYSDISSSFPDVPVFDNGIFYYDIALDVDQFEAELTFGYTDSLLDALGIDEDSLAVSYYDSTDSRGYIWHSIPCVINKITNSITVTVSHFSLWAVTGKDEPLITHITEQEKQYPDDFKLFSNYPNPFNPETTIVYQIPKSSFVTIKIYNVIGKAVKTLVNTQKNPGRYSVKWDGTNEFGQTVSSGLYIYHLQAGEFSAVKKMLFIK